VRTVLSLLEQHLPEVDRALQGALENWRLERLSTLDRAVLRLAAAEMLYLDEVPPKVSIQEAIRLSEQYGGSDSPRFVNGVLDALYKRLPGAGV
jgi:N utilization substance protein B